MSRDISEAMRGYVPSYYDEILEAREILAAEVRELEALVANIDGYADQMSPSSATQGLARWEAVLGLDPTTPSATWGELSRSNSTFGELNETQWGEIGNGSKPRRAERRSKIKSRLRGIGTITESLIKSVAESYSNGSVHITVDPANYTVTVRFVGELGVPVLLDDIKRVLRESIPAHLAIKYEYSYMNFAQLTSYAFTFDTLTAERLTFEQLGKYSQ